MPESVTHVLKIVTHLLEIAGAGALILGFVIATVQVVRRMRTAGPRPAYGAYRQALGTGWLEIALRGFDLLNAGFRDLMAVETAGGAEMGGRWMSRRVFLMARGSL